MGDTKIGNIPPEKEATIIRDDKISAKIDEMRTNLESVESERDEVKEAAMHKSEIREKYLTILGDVKCVMIALDGTLFNIQCDDMVPIPNALKAFRQLKESGLRILLVVNTWLKCKKRILKMLHKLGFPVAQNELFTSSDCCKILMKRHNFRHPFLLVTDDVLKDFPNMETFDPTQFDCVVLGLPSTMIDYRLMTKTLNILYEGCPMLVLHTRKSEKAIGSSKVIAPGLFSQALEFATDAERLLPAKSTAGFYAEACKYAGFSPQNCLMIGDNIAEDFRDAKAICMRAALVKTGIYSIHDENKFCNLKPGVVAHDFVTVIRILLAVISTEPDTESDDAEEALRKARLQSQMDDFYMRLNSYAASDCNRKKSLCPPKLPSIIW